MRICDRLLNFVQVINHRGDVRCCSWMKDNVIGNLSQSSFAEIWHGEKMRQIYKKIAQGDFSQCGFDACPWLSNGTVNDHSIDIENWPEYPTGLHLAFEEVCNYNCTCCTSRVTWAKDTPAEKEAGYCNIYERLIPVLPHIREIGANGRGELFRSEHILRLLSEWRPIAPRGECRVLLETNGSFFDEKHWKQIENLGKYYLSVAITVMSFDEHIYQVLSGTKLPILQIENNLHFVKSLRKQGIVNHFEIATVVQERNFRTMPEFVKRCVEEFCADSVRLRPYQIHGSGYPERDWFTDVRGAYHPYHDEYKEVMRNPIFTHPKVHDWGGGHESQTGDLPQKVALDKARISSGLLKKKLTLSTRMILEENIDDLLKPYLSNRDLIIYGIGEIGQIFTKLVMDKYRIQFILDKSKRGTFLGIPVRAAENIPFSARCANIVVTPLASFHEICNDLRRLNYSGVLIDIAKLFT